MKNLGDLLSMFTKANTQRAKMAMLLSNLSIQEFIPLPVRASICTSMWDMMKNDTDAVMDSELINLFNQVIDKVEVEMKEATDITDFRQYMDGVLDKADKIINKDKRVNEGNDILNKLNLS